MRRISRFSPPGALLDVGCAYGPFLQAASDAGWSVCGVDVSESAVSYVRDSLGFRAAHVSLEDFDPQAAFGRDSFDGVTLWFVLEHFRDAGAALRKISSLLRPGGIFAFSTPSASGISARANPQAFFEKSPADHFTLWEPRRAPAILESFGFEVIDTLSTGHHPERFPGKQGIPRNSPLFKFLGLWSAFRGLGDTFEMYCRKK
jgi:SAM-dependent methyltransferase